MKTNFKDSPLHMVFMKKISFSLMATMFELGYHGNQATPTLEFTW